MTYIMIESSVRTHKKMLAAGPAASWLWCCGLGYCQDGLTDGHIPRSALDFLGVKSPQKLAEKLVRVGLWETAKDGWHVHDYRRHNKSAEQIREIMRKRTEGGALGGRPKKTLEVNHQGYEVSKNSETSLKTLSCTSCTSVLNDQDQDQRADARPAHYPQLLKLAHVVLDGLNPEADAPPMSELCARLKDLAGTYQIPHAVSREITKAMDSAIAQRRAAL
jgi:hypothetical protein